MVSLLSLSGGFAGIVVCGYVFSFSCLLCCFETHLKAISRVIGENFGFMYNVRGRVAFLILVAFLCFGLGLLGLIAGLAMFAVAGFNAYAIYKNPGYEEKTREDDIEQRGPGSLAESGTGLAGDMGYAPPGAGEIGGQIAGAGLTWARENPEAASSAARQGVAWAQENPEEAQRLAGAVADL